MNYSLSPSCRSCLEQVNLTNFSNLTNPASEWIGFQNIAYVFIWTGKMFPHRKNLVHMKCLMIEFNNDQVSRLALEELSYVPRSASL